MSKQLSTLSRVLDRSSGAYRTCVTSGPSMVPRPVLTRACGSYALDLPYEKGEPTVRGTRVVVERVLRSEPGSEPHCADARPQWPPLREHPQPQQQQQKAGGLAGVELSKTGRFERSGLRDTVVVSKLLSMVGELAEFPSAGCGTQCLLFVAFFSFCAAASLHRQMEARTPCH